MLAARAAGDGRELSLLEADCVRIGHAECMAVVYESWRLPESLVTATRFHHTPLAAPPAHQRLAALVNVGGALAVESGYAYSLEPTAVPAASEVLELLSLDTEQLLTVRKALPRRVMALVEALLN
jgi:HD-like signal output (HDOD) protein